MGKLIKMDLNSNEWDEHWSRRFIMLNGFFNFYRKYVMSNALSHYIEKYFPKNGTFVECGSGSSLTSHLIKKYKRKLVALDISKKALEEAEANGKMDKFVHADITKKLPFGNESIDGIWNLGVMEHFSKKEIDKTMKEFHRTLKKGAYVIMFIPPVYSFTGMAYRTVENIIKLTTGKSFRFYPDEPSRLKSKKDGIDMVRRNGFDDCRVYFPWRNCFGDLVVIARKP